MTCNKLKFNDEKKKKNPTPEAITAGTRLRSSVCFLWWAPQSWWSWDSFQTIWKQSWCLAWFKSDNEQAGEQSLPHELSRNVDWASLDHFLTEKATMHLVCSWTLNKLHYWNFLLVSDMSKTVQQNLCTKRNAEIMLHLFSKNYTGFQLNKEQISKLQNKLIDTSTTLYPLTYQPGLLLIHLPDHSDPVLLNSCLLPG